MTKTFTPELEFTAKLRDPENDVFAESHAEPSFLVIQNILNYSRNLEVLKSSDDRFFSLVKS